MYDQQMDKVITHIYEKYQIQQQFVDGSFLLTSGDILSRSGLSRATYNSPQKEPTTAKKTSQSTPKSPPPNQNQVENSKNVISVGAGAVVESTNVIVIGHEGAASSGNVIEQVNDSKVTMLKVGTGKKVRRPSSKTIKVTSDFYKSSVKSFDKKFYPNLNTQHQRKKT